MPTLPRFEVKSNSDFHVTKFWARVFWGGGVLQERSYAAPDQRAFETIDKVNNHRGEASFEGVPGCRIGVLKTIKRVFWGDQVGGNDVQRAVRVWQRCLQEEG